jgi:hypothetical protein
MQSLRDTNFNHYCRILFIVNVKWIYQKYNQFRNDVK